VNVVGIYLNFSNSLDSGIAESRNGTGRGGASNGHLSVRGARKNDGNQPLPMCTVYLRGDSGPDRKKTRDPVRNRSHERRTREGTDIVPCGNQRKRRFAADVTAERRLLNFKKKTIANASESQRQNRRRITQQQKERSGLKTRVTAPGEKTADPGEIRALLFSLQVGSGHPRLGGVPKGRKGEELRKWKPMQT